MSPKRVAPSVRRPWMLCAAAFLAIAWSATLPARAADGLPAATGTPTATATATPRPVVTATPRPSTSCTAGPNTLCLLGRFEVTVRYRISQTAQPASAGVVPGANRNDSGLFYYSEFGPQNWEFLAKGVNLCATANPIFALLVGAASDREYQVAITDKLTGDRKTFDNAQGNRPVLFRTAFATCAATGASADPLDERIDVAVLSAANEARNDLQKALGDLQAIESPEDAAAIAADAPVAITEPLAACIPTSERLCILGGRFSATLQYRLDSTQDYRLAGVVPDPSADDSGLFYYPEFGATNWEMLVKGADLCSSQNFFNVIASAATDRDFLLTVTDTQTGEARTYRNVQGDFPALFREAFPTCAGPVNNIQQAIDAAPDGGTVVIPGGPHVGAFRVTNKSITLQGANVDYPQTAPELVGTGSATVLTLQCNAGQVVTVDRVVIRGGRSSGNGGGILNQGCTLVVRGQTALADNQAAGQGGGLWSNAPVLIENTAIRDCKASQGAGLYTTATAIVRDSSISGGEATGGANDRGGAAIYATADLEVYKGSISANKGAWYAGPGGIWFRGTGTLTIYQVRIDHNEGGAILNDRGTLTVNDSRIEANVAEPAAVSGSTGLEDPAAVSGRGSAIENGGTATLTANDFFNNTGRGAGGAILNNGKMTVVGGNLRGNVCSTAGGGVGGAIANGGELTIDGAQVTENTARQRGGGVYNEGKLVLRGNTTISGNLARDVQNGNPGEGGGIYNGSGGTVAFTSAQVTGNSPDNCAGTGISCP